MSLRTAPLWTVFLLALAGLGCGSHPEPGPLWVGHLAPLSGPEQALGERARQGIKLAVDEAREEGRNSSGRLLSFRHADASEPDQIRAQTVRLATVNKVAALVAGPRPGDASPVVQAARPYTLPVVVPTSFAGSPGKEVVVLGATPAWRGTALARYASRDLKQSAAAVLHASADPSAEELAGAFVREWSHVKDQRVREWWAERDGEPGELAKAVAAWKPGVVLVAAAPAEFARWRDRLRQAGWKGPVLASSETRPEALAGEDGEVYRVTTWAREGLTEQGKRFAAAYEKRVGEPPDQAAAEAYDAARLLLEVAADIGNGGAEQLRDKLLGRESFESVTGTVTWKDRLPRRRVFVVRQGKEAEVVRTLEPD